VFSARFGVTGDAYATVTHAFTSPEQTKTAAGIIGTLTTVAFAVSFTTALQRVFLRAWRRPPGGGARNQARGAAWLGAVLVLLLMVVAAGVVLNGPVGSVFSWVLGLLACTGLWWWTARLMVRGEVRWRALPTAIVMGIGGWLYTVAAAVWMPVDVASQYAQFGAFGITQSFVTWFTGMAFLLILAAVLGPALADGHHPRPVDVLGESHRRRGPRRGGATRARPAGAAVRRLRAWQPRIRRADDRPGQRRRRYHLTTRGTIGD
jgi:membrane protein